MGSNWQDVNHNLLLSAGWKATVNAGFIIISFQGCTQIQRIFE